MTAERQTPLHAMVERWLRQAHGYEIQANGKGDYTDIERELLKMHARVKRADAQELKEEISKVRRG